MAKLRYGKRFNNGIASTTANYGTTIDDAARGKDVGKMVGIMRNMPQYKRELIGHQAGVRAKARAIDDSGRQHAEKAMVAAVRQAVELLEFHMNELMEHREITGHGHAVNQKGIHNALVMLRTKCGVAFEPSEYDKRVPLDESILKPERVERDDRPDYRAEQRQARERHMRAVTDRLLSRTHNNGR